jgi:hypothetical protein
MNTNYEDKKEIPLAAAVQVLRYRPDERSGELQPWPVATIQFDAAGGVQFFGDAAKSYEWLLRATKKAAARIAHQSVVDAMREASALKLEDSKL